MGSYRAIDGLVFILSECFGSARDCQRVNSSGVGKSGISEIDAKIRSGIYFAGFKADLMERRKILIATKTYPSISQKYRETVCTAGVLLDEREQPLQWIRIYPIRFRQAEIDLMKAPWKNEKRKEDRR
jgi:hypothetical protein